MDELLHLSNQSANTGIRKKKISKHWDKYKNDIFHSIYDLEKGRRIIF